MGNEIYFSILFSILKFQTWPKCVHVMKGNTLEMPHPLGLRASKQAPLLTQPLNLLQKRMEKKKKDTRNMLVVY